MRYIEKGAEPVFMTEWKNSRNEAGQPLDYDSFNYKRELNDVLRQEQHGICCYCQRRIDHFQGDKTTGAHNEHLIPQKGPYGDFSKQMDYGNLYACCIDSQGTKQKEKDKRHCGEAKGFDLIPPFIQDAKCADYFKYNVNGEILPNGDFDEWCDYLANESKLAGKVLEAYNTIKTLNLNCHFLVDDRRGDIVKLISILNSKDNASVVQMMSDFESRATYPRYIDMLLYYMKRKK